MRTQDNTRTELQGISAFESLLLKSDLLDPNIFRKDKYPVWDGDVLVYEKSGRMKTDLFGRIPVQVKSTMVKNFSAFKKRKKTTFKVDDGDLEHYKNDGGIIFILIELWEDDERNISYKIYTASLLPADLNHSLQTNSKSIKLKLFSSNIGDSISIKSMENYFFNFISNKKLQASTATFSKKFDTNEKYFSPFMTDFRMTNNLSKLNTELYLYEQLDDNNFSVVDKINIEQLIATGASNVHVNGVMFFDEISISPTEKSGDTIQIGNSVKYFVRSKTLEIGVNHGTFYERKKDICFIKALYSNGSFNIDDKIIYFDKADFGNLNNIDEVLQHYELTTQLLDLFNIEKDLLLDQFTKNDYERLDILINSFVLSNKNIDQSNGTNTYNIQLGNIFITVWINSNQDNTIDFYDFYSENLTEKANITIKYNDHEVYKHPCIYTFISSQQMIDSININHQLVTQTICSMKVTDNYADEILNYVLRLLTVYDAINDVEALKSASTILEYISPNIEDNLYRINYLQIKKRQSSLAPEDIDKILMIQSTCADDLFTMAATYILLDSKISYLHYFNKLDPEQQEIFGSYPIVNLIDQSNLMIPTKWPE